MANADGSIIIDATVDDKQAEQKLKSLNKTIDSTEKQISKLQAAKLPLVEEAKKLGAELDAAKEKLAYMESGNEFFTGAQIKEQTASVNQMQKAFDSVNNKIDATDTKINGLTAELRGAQSQAGAVQAQMSRVGYKAGKAIEEASELTASFTKRLKTLARRVLVFSLFTAALRGVKDWLGNVIQTNGEATAAMARLKGALLTMAQPLVDVVIPAFITLVNVLTAVVGQIAQMVSGVFGTTADASAEAAESLHKQTETLNETGKAAKKASKSLASFDEINKLSSGTSGGAEKQEIAPDFSWQEGISERLQQIAKDVLLIAAGFALWKIASHLPGQIGDVASKIGGVLIALGGFIMLYQGVTDAWQNGIDWGNLGMMIAGVAAAAAGLFLVFGKVGAGIALIVGGVALLVTGFKDVITNGANLKNTLAIIAGIIGTGLGIFLITGSLIPLLIAGIAAVVVAILAWQGNLGEFAEAFKQIFGGIVDFFKGVFTGDMELAWKGIRNVIIGVINAIILAFESFVNAAIDGLNWLINKANSLADAVGINARIPRIPRIDIPTIPYLAQGAVIPPNREFLAVLGDQRSGTNIETPLATMVEAFRTAMRDMNMGGQNEAVLMVDDEALGRIVYRLYNKENNRIGVSFSD